MGTSLHNLPPGYWKIKMKTIVIIFIFFGIGAVLGAPGKDPTIKDFEEMFHQTFTDPKAEEAAAKELALKEAEIDKENEDYENGDAHFEEELEPWDDLSEEEFLVEKAGLTPDGDFRTGLLPTPEEDKVNTPEEREYLENVYAKYDRKRMPRTWDSRAKGLITSVKNQGSCGSCVAFATMGMAEASLIKAGAKKDGLDLSEQWLSKKKNYLVHENDSPYKGSKGPKDACSQVSYWSPGYKFSKVASEYRPDDEKIMKLIMEHGSAVVGVYSSGGFKKFGNSFSDYGSGIFDKCDKTKTPNHAVLVVGWGALKEDWRNPGVWKECSSSSSSCIKFWIIKNSR